MVKVKKWISKLALVGCILLFLLIWFLTYYNDGSWYLNILTYTIPGLLILSFLCICILFLVKEKQYGFVLLFGYIALHKPIKETFSVGYLFAPKIEKGDSTLNVMTFNASTFNNHRIEPFQSDDSLFKSDFFGYLQSSSKDLDVICFQEFHHDDADNQRIVDEVVKHTGSKYYYTVPIWQSDQTGFFGIITLSKHPIVARGTLFVGDKHTLNRGIFTDILYGGDTIRVINIHLHSMNIRLNQEDSVGNVQKVKGVIQSLKVGSIKSKAQIEQVLSAISASRYPIILCGDFNTFPYGYSYQQVKKRLKNSFEEAGKGFGFSLNIAPYFVRVDNQFVSKEFTAVESQMFRSIKKSDHFPLVVKYIKEKKRP